MQISGLSAPARTASNSHLIGRPVGRPRVKLDSEQLVALREGGRLSWRAIAKQLGVGVTTVRRAYQETKRLGAAAQNLEDCRPAEGSSQGEGS